MTRDSFQAAVRRMRRIMLITTIVVAGPVLYGLMRLMDVFDVPSQSYAEAVRSRFGEGLGGAICGLWIGLIACVPLGLWLAVMVVFERRMGARCPHCHHLLTARCLPRRVLESGECSRCHGRIFDD